jgi:hypothetical protein
VAIGQAWEMEKPYLRPLPEHDLECCATRPVTLNPYSQVEFETNRYSVPADKARRNLVIKAYPFRIHILCLEEVIASHPRCYDRQQDVLDPLHYLPLLEQRPGAFDHADGWLHPHPSVAGGEAGPQSMSVCWPNCELNGRTVEECGSSSAF